MLTGLPGSHRHLCVVPVASMAASSGASSPSVTHRACKDSAEGFLSFQVHSCPGSSRHAIPCRSIAIPFPDITNDGLDSEAQ